MSRLPVALQLYTVRDRLAEDFAGTLRQVAEMGYTSVELAGTGGLSAGELKALLDSLGLRPVGPHTAIAQLAGELDELFAWSRQPTPIEPKVVGRFCGVVFDGLSKERHGKLAHKNTYVQWALDRIASQIGEFNKKLEG